MKQGYNSRLDESLGARNGKKTQSLKDRRDESKGANKGAGNRAYSSVSTMDKPKVKQKLRRDGTVKKTVTRTKGGVEKEIERGNKRIDVRKYKDEGVKTRTVTNMKKNDQYKKDNSGLKQNPKTGKFSIKGTNVEDLIKNSTFKNMPHSMVKEAAKPENNILPANQMDRMEQKKNQPMTNMLNRESEKQRKENQ
tara:strand:- start:147 stop:728 length:582 start_codon:yes stop_codon:yes gene_type:complete